MLGSDLGNKYRNFILITYNVIQVSLTKLFKNHVLRNGKLNKFLQKNTEVLISP